MTARTPVLMSPENPEGWKLEELARQLRLEIHAKCDKIKGDDRAQARLVLANNQAIIGALESIERLQYQSMAALEEIGPNQGPLGTPRIGVGSEAAEAAVAFDQPEESRVRATDDEIEVGDFALRRHGDVIVTDEWGVDLSPDEARAVAEWIMRAIGGPASSASAPEAAS